MNNEFNCLGSLYMRMWSSNNHREGFRKCTSIGYTLSVIADLFYLFFLISPFAFGGVIAYSIFEGKYAHSLLLMFFATIISFIVSWLLNKVALGIAERKGFKYDYEKDKCTWNQP